MRDFKKRELPIHYRINWESADEGTAIFLGKSVFLDPECNLLTEEINEFKEIAKHNGVTLVMRRHYTKLIVNKHGDTKQELVGFWFYCIGLTVNHKKKSAKNYDYNCAHEIINIFRTRTKPIRLQALIKNYGLDYSGPKVRTALKHLAATGFLIEEKVDAKSGHVGRPTVQYKATENLKDYVIPSRNFGSLTLPDDVKEEKETR